MAFDTVSVKRFKVENIDWELVLKRKRKSDKKKCDDDLILDFNCLYNGRISNLWSFDAELHADLADCDFDEKLKRHFDNRSTNVSFEIGGTNIPLHRIFLCLNLRVNVTSVSGMHTFKLSDFQTPRNIDSEVVLLHGARKLYVDRYALMCISPVFRKMLSDGTNNTINLYKYIDYKWFVDFLCIAYRQSPNIITSENVDGLITIAKRYEIQFLMSECEDFLISTESLSTLEKLHVAEFRQFSKLQKKVLEKLTKEEVKKIEKEKMTTMLDATANAFLERKCEIGKEPFDVKWLKDLLWNPKLRKIVVSLIIFVSYTWLIIHFATTIKHFFIR